MVICKHGRHEISTQNRNLLPEAENAFIIHVTMNETIERITAPKRHPECSAVIFVFSVCSTVALVTVKQVTLCKWNAVATCSSHIACDNTTQNYLFIKGHRKLLSWVCWGIATSCLCNQNAKRLQPYNIVGVTARGHDVVSCMSRH